jgi:hypothetical protein
MSCERLFGYLSCIGTKDRKTHNVMKTLIDFLVLGANTKNKSNIMSMWLYCTFLIYKLFHWNVIIVQMISHVRLFKQSHSHSHVLFHSINHILTLIYRFIQSITFSLSCIVSFKQSHSHSHVLFHSNNHILTLMYCFIQAITFSLSCIVSFKQSHSHSHVLFHSINHLVKIELSICKFPFNCVLFHSSNQIFALSYIVSFNQTHHDMYCFSFNQSHCHFISIL